MRQTSESIIGRYVFGGLAVAFIRLTPVGWQDSKWGSIVHMGILRDEWSAPRAGSQAKFVEPSVDCNAFGAPEHVRLGY
jgi:hypothetical protein